MNLKTTLIALSLAAIMLGLNYQPAQSQALPLLEMTFKSFQGNYQPLGSYDWQYSGSQYYYYPRINLPFTFYYDQQPNTFVYFGANAYLSLRPYGYNYYGYYTGQPITRMNSVIKVFSMYYGGPYPGTMRYKVEGSAPNRVAIFEWNGHEAYFGNYGSGSNFQCRLYETSNMVELIYGRIDYSNYYYWNDYPYDYRYYRGQNGFGGRIRNGHYINVLPQDNYNMRGCYSNVQEDRQKNTQGDDCLRKDVTPMYRKTDKRFTITSET